MKCFNLIFLMILLAYCYADETETNPGKYFFFYCRNVLSKKMIGLFFFLSFLAETVDICKMPKDVGPCRAVYPRFYFDYPNGKCESFHYGGCKGNENNFKTIEDCIASCSNVPTKTTT